MKRSAVVLALAAAILVFAFGPQSDARADTVTTNLFPGWNLFSYLGPSQALPRALAQIDGKYDSVWSLDGAMQTWSGFDPDAPVAVNDLRVLRRFDSYAIHLREAATLALDPDAPPPLANPFLPAERVTTLPGPEFPEPRPIPEPIPGPLPPSPPEFIRIVGEVRNLSDANVGNVQIVALAQDRAGNVTGVIPFGRALRSIIPVGEVSPFDISGPASAGAASRFLVVAAGDPTPEGAPPLTLLNVVVQRSTLIPELACLSGEVRNDGTSAVSFIRVVGSLSNASGDIISVFETFVGDFGRFGPSALEPGQTRPFDACIDAPAEEIASLNLWAEAEPAFFGPFGQEALDDGAPLQEVALAASTLTTNLFPGWNLFSYLGASQPMPQALAQIEGSFSAVWALDGASQEWSAFDPDAAAVANDLTGLEQYGSYMINMRQADSLAFEVAAPPSLVNSRLPTERTSVFAPAEFFFPAGGAIIVGEVRNLSDANVLFPQIIAFLRDARGNVVDIEPFGFSLRRIVPVGEATPFELFFQLKAAHASFDLVAAGQPTDESPPTGLTLLNLSGPFERFGATCVAGEVRNDSDQPFGFVRIVGSLYDASGDVVRTVQGFVSLGEPFFPKGVDEEGVPAPTPAVPPFPPEFPVLEPGATAPFEACAFPSVAVDEVADFMLWVEAEPFFGPPPPPGEPPRPAEPPPPPPGEPPPPAEPAPPLE